MSYPKDSVPYQGKCNKYCVYPNKNMYFYVSCKNVEPSESHFYYATPPSNRAGPIRKHGALFALVSQSYSGILFNNSPAS